MKFSFMIVFVTLLSSSCFAQQSCPFLPNPHNIYSYIEMTVDRNYTRNCAPGTIYSKDHCLCITDTNATRRHEDQRRCNPSLLLNFENDLFDKSSNNLPLYSAKVTLSNNGTALFSPNSRMTIWRFSNVAFRQGLYITLSILSTAQTSDRQIIFTNDGSSNLDGPSISAAIEGEKYVFQLVTSARQETITIDKEPGFNNVTLMYNSREFRVSCNNATVSRKLTGVIHKKITALTIGGFNGKSFTGELGDFELFTCIPENAQ
ncbi:shell matrix protein isoform X2 [Octopus bimaculoides]|uniref:shell matrix protein isoform X2 n=1 Tax=Octopus bimaculoides TaxID=37653 RepID=UPI00071DFE08|nr:shell matrix protein isoform X2 [Octopus bimaculoides]XP_052825954.1 shell matrix protein isoform X2 [Octopus bimaculoides]|eukprot:XP_014774955.1 PREDICTED: shell matrix protein-like isoform X2 [Octopus bimaculoides]